MAFNETDTRVYIVPLIDVNWLVYAPFDPGRDFRVDPPNVEQSVKDLDQLMGEMSSLTDSKFILTPHSGTYCRTDYYDGEILELYKKAVFAGGELSVHLHEEIKGVGTRYGEWDHCLSVFQDCKHRLEAAGITPVAYRGGHYAYNPFMNKMLSDNEVFVDYSCCPGMNFPEREAIWTHAELNASYLPEDIRAPWEGQKRSNVLEIPIGSDGKGSSYKNILHVEQSDMENLTRIWDEIVERAEKTDECQIVHCLFHTASVGVPEWIARYRKFLDMVPQRKGQFITTVEAIALKERFAKEVS